MMVETKNELILVLDDLIGEAIFLTRSKRWTTCRDFESGRCLYVNPAIKCVKCKKYEKKEM